MTNQHVPTTPKKQLQEMNILYLGLISGQIMMAVILWFFVGKQGGGESTTELGRTIGETNPIIFMIALVFVAAVSASFFLYNKRKEEGRKLEEALTDKLTHYRSSFILRMALLEGPNLMALVLYFFIESHVLLMALFIIGLALFLMISPTVKRISEDYQLSVSEQSELRNSTL